MSKEKNTRVEEDMVSIVMPAYNCGDFIEVALDSVISQIYQNWEVIVVDDCSTDNTAKLVKAYMSREPRIKYNKLNTNSGAAVARNEAVNLAKGKYIAFLDSDDVWFHDKLSKQINFMKQNKYDFTCTSYTKIDKNGNDLNRKIKAKIKSDYDGVLKRNPGNSTVIYNAQALGKFKIPNIKKRNDYVMWLQAIKKAKNLYGIEEPLGSHRIRIGSLSSKKGGLVGYHWKVYREIEHLSIVKSCYLILYWVIFTIFKLR
ncbi:glycosyltransferase family 2 protein [Paraliobacillus sediminis]|uniref:glycosyltransferase family 2 protein n=1 Tax=Paraliobacillus sediminis TaxID=1885916 RepID=UPI000E3E171A|nr:glycosyltransferase family 2 protein [Paraliobacillus sediminis]